MNFQMLKNLIDFNYLNQIFQLNLKQMPIKKINILDYMDPGSGEYYKIKNWVDTFMRIPFGKYKNLPVSIADGEDKCQ